MEDAPTRKSAAHDHAANVAGESWGVLRVKWKARHYVYLARASDGAFYCGYALDPRARIAAHNAGKGAKALRGRRPVSLVYMRRCTSKGEALRFEAALKRRSHADKEALARHWRG